MKNLILRPEESGQYHAMEELVREAFWDRFSPGCSEHLVVHAPTVPARSAKANWTANWPAGSGMPGPRCGIPTVPKLRS